MDKRTILVVDDNEDLLCDLSGYLESLGYEVIQAWNGNQAVKRLLRQDCKIDVVVCDLEMPNGNGYEVLRSQRGREDGEIPIIMHTAGKDSLSTKETVDLLIGKGAWAVVIKGIGSFPQIRDAVARVLENKE